MKTLFTLLLIAITARGGEQPATFERDVAPILQRRCASCHDRDSSKGAYRLDTFAEMLKPGDSGAAPVTAGQSAQSEIIRLLTSADDDERMPRKAAALPVEEIALIRRWIDDGASFPGDHARPIVELVRGQHLRPAPPHYSRPVPVTALAFDADNRRIASSGYREINVWDTSTTALVRRIGGLPERIAAMAWHPSDDLIGIAGGTPGQWGTVALVDPRRGDSVRFLCDLPDLALSVAFSNDGRLLVAGCIDRTTRVFEVASGKQIRVLRQHSDWVQSVAFSPDDARLVTASRDRTARVLDSGTWEATATYQDHDAALLTAAFTTDGSRIISTTRNSAHAWHPTQANKRGDFADLGGGVTALARGSFGIAAACADGVLRFYQIDERQPWLSLAGHRDAISALAVNRRGDLLASGSADGEVIVWSPACWAPVARFTAAP